MTITRARDTARPAVPEPSLLGRLLDARGPVRVDPSWWAWTGPHGGALAGHLLRACSREAGQGRSPRALTVQLLRAVGDGPVETTTELVREGAAASVVTAQLRGADGKLSALATLTSGHARGGGEPYAGVPMPEVAAPLDCPLAPPPAELVPFTQHLDFRLAAGPPALGVPGERPELVLWVRLRSDDPLDAARLAVLADAVPPALYAVARVPVPVPTVELSLSFAPGLDEAPGRGWVLVRIATRSAADGWCVDDSEVWAPDGRLLVQARQTRRVLGELTR